MIDQKKKRKYKSKYNQTFLNQIKDKYGVSIDSVRKALKGTRTGALSIKLKEEYDKLNTISDKKIQISDKNNGLGISNVIPIKNNQLVKSINHVSDQNETFDISGDIANFLGRIEKKPIGSVACTLDAPQGAGKTRFFFQIMNELAKKYKVLFISLEEHPQSSLFKEKVAQYIEPENQTHIDTVGELERGKEKETLNKLIPNYDIVFVDSWNKIYEASKLDFDTDLRKAYNGKLIFAIFQRTVTGTMRGGAKAQFDGDIIMKIEKGETFKQNEVYHDKNRYQNKDLSLLRYNIYDKSLTGELLNIIPVSNQPNQMIKSVNVWEDMTINF